MLLLETFLVFRARGHDGGHVRLVERRQHGGAVLRFLEAARDGLAKARHAHALFAGADHARRRWRRGRRHGGARFKRGERVRLGDAPLPAGAGDVFEVDAVLGDDALYRGAALVWRRRAGCGAGFAAAGAAAGFAAGAAAGLALAAAPLPRWPRIAPIPTVAPSAATMSVSVPASGAETSTETLSVSSSTSVSSFFTASPAFFSHLATVASDTDSPSVGTTMSVISNHPSASPRSVSNSFRCLLIRPAAVDAVAGRPA